MVIVDGFEWFWMVGIRVRGQPSMSRAHAGLPPCRGASFPGLEHALTPSLAGTAGTGTFYSP